MHLPTEVLCWIFVSGSSSLDPWRKAPHWPLLALLAICEDKAKLWWSEYTIPDLPSHTHCTWDTHICLLSRTTILMHFLFMLGAMVWYFYKFRWNDTSTISCNTVLLFHSHHFSGPLLVHATRGMQCIVGRPWTSWYQLCNIVWYCMAQK